MSLIEKILDVDYFMYQAISCLLFGFIYIVIATFIGLEIENAILYISIAVGFVIGSVVKVQIMSKKEK